MMSPMGVTVGGTVLSRHSGYGRWRGDVKVRNASSGCTIPGSPYVGGLVLAPHGAGQHSVVVEYGPWSLERPLDSLTFIVDAPDLDVSSAPVEVAVTILDLHGETLGAKSCVLRTPEEQVETVRFPGAERDVVLVRFELASVEPGAGRPVAARFRYVLAYRSNTLADLFNAAGSDKGTSCYAGKGVPHCYALEYQPLLQPLVGRTFDMLEIGLQVRKDSTGLATDVPSLRVWQEFFPGATIYGLDLADFSFADGESVRTFRADQGSRDELRAFLEASGYPTFALVIDDGSHASSDQQTSLAVLFAHVAPGGIYIIEDLNWQPREEPARTLDVLRQVERGGPFESPFITTEEAAYLNEAVDRVDILRPNDSEFAVIWKKDRGSIMAGDR